MGEETFPGLVTTPKIRMWSRGGEVVRVMGWCPGGAPWRPCLIPPDLPLLLGLPLNYQPGTLRWDWR